MTPKELKYIAPKLYELQKLKSGFNIPKEYFKTIDDRVMTFLFLSDFNKKNTFDIPDNYFELVEISVLEKIRNQNTSVPKNYFSTVEDKVFEKIRNEKKSNPVKIFTLQKLSILAVAASIILLFTLQFFKVKDNNQFASLDLLDIEYWVESGELEFDSHEIALAYKDITLDDFNIYNYYADDEILDYLDGVDVELLILTD